ncbi:MAG: NADH-quinone oxidoreductase subunit J [Actinomycetota bacterium]
MTALDVLFAALALLTAAAGLLAVTTRQVVHAALWLVVALGGLAGVYLVLGAEVVALVQLLVYVGAIVVLVLFALMLTRAPVGPDDVDAPLPQRVAAAAAGGSLAALVGTTLLLSGPGAVVDVRPDRGGAAAVGGAVFADWVLPFELLSVLLLAALVGAVAVSRKRSGDVT